MAKHSGFTEKIVAGRTVDEIAHAAWLGDAATTAGAKLAERHRRALLAWQYNEYAGEAERARFEQVQWEIGEALAREDSNILREMAAYFEAIKLWRKGGAISVGKNKVKLPPGSVKSPHHLWAANFIWACQNRDRSMTIPDSLRKFNTWVNALARPVFTPKVREVWEFLGEVFGDLAPDYRTTERYCRLCGIKPEPRGRARHRQ